MAERSSIADQGTMVADVMIVTESATIVTMSVVIGHHRVVPTAEIEVLDDTEIKETKILKSTIWMTLAIL